tara:strand:+ start:56 stop:466 length:411 start_codon:yes stop_codon:yes gene_type:complete
MSDEQAMEIIENLSEELGEKELKIMALEKELEEQTKVIKKMTELSEIKEYKMEFLEFDREEDTFCPGWIIDNNTEVDDVLMIKVILHYFGGSIMNKADIIKEYGDIDFNSELDFAIPGVDLEDLDNDTGDFWVCKR